MAELRPAKFPIRWAMGEFFEGPDRAALEEFLRWEAILPSNELAGQLQIVWSCMAKMAIEGRVEVVGHLERAPHESVVGTGLLQNSRTDAELRTVTTDIGTYYGVSIGRLVPESRQTERPPEPPPLAAAPVAGVAAAGRKRGRRPKHDWAGLMAALATKLSDDGIPAEGEKAELERWAASQMITQPAESEIRLYVTRAIEAHRKSIG